MGGRGLAEPQSHVAGPEKASFVVGEDGLGNSKYGGQLCGNTGKEEEEGEGVRRKGMHCLKH